MNLYLIAISECFQTDLLLQAEENVILLTREKCRTVITSEVTKSHPKGDDDIEFLMG